MNLSIVNLQMDSSKEWLEHASNLLDSKGLARMALLLWNLWNRINQWVHDGDLQVDHDVVSKTWELAASFKVVTESSNHSSPNRRPSVQALWNHPSVGRVKINVDGAFINRSSEATLGLIARDHHGMVFGDAPQMTESVEALTIVQAVRFAIENDWDHVIIKGDAIRIVNRLNYHSEDISVVDMLLNEVHEKLAAHLN
ncbi:uncharacterized protein LOC120142489 [Hibiscus syriacus]|uniref:uncharacterized protein LOC120142489 n=1 Tax=Hibiscus syriacus TaxID=106335 RepID=UPI0019223B7A|nr:uncharacterized protein LOC120142489 [Hibiscus syriacus]